MKVHYIYKITCLCGSFKNHYYIGKRSSRKTDILNDYYYGSGEKLRRYYKKYPPVLGETITKEILEINQTKEINCQREKEIIGDLYLTDPLCLNLMEGGNGRKVSKETSRKKSDAYKGRKLSEETRKKMSIAKKRDNSVSSLRKYYETHEVWNKGVPSINRKPVACYNLNGEFIKIYSSVSEASQENNISDGGIAGCILKPNEHHKAGNFMWLPVCDNQPMKIRSYKEIQKERYYKNKKKIEQYTPDGKLIKTWESVKEVAESFGYKSYSVVSKLLNTPDFPPSQNNSNNIYNFIWRRAS